MIELFKTLTIEQVIIYSVLIIIAAKGVFDFILYIKKIYKDKFDKDYNKKQREELITRYKADIADMQNKMIECHSSVGNKIDDLTNTLNGRMDEMEEQLNILTVSDMHDIKGWIVEKHHLLMKKGWVDDFTMDTIEKRYSDYEKEGGNTYVHTLVEELRTLPHTPPQK